MLRQMRPAICLQLCLPHPKAWKRSPTPSPTVKANLQITLICTNRSVFHISLLGIRSESKRIFLPAVNPLFPLLKKYGILVAILENAKGKQAVAMP